MQLHNTIITLLLFVTLPLVAQQPDTTLVLDEVVVSHTQQREQRSLGSKVTRIEQVVLERSQTLSLSELLSENSVLHVKSLGQGALATASFRGTSANHTQVLWNGISLNAATLGSFDFSQMPVYFMDNVTLMHGSTAQQGGSGALGGSVNLSSNLATRSTPYYSLLCEYGSNQTRALGATLRTGWGRWLSSTRIFYQASENDYRYLNTLYSKESFYEDRANAAYQQAGALQELLYQTERGDRWNIIGWYQYEERELPPPIITQAGALESTQSTNLRFLASYEAERGAHRVKVTAANLWNNFDYAKRLGTFENTNRNRVNSVELRGDYSYQHSRQVELGATAKLRNDRVANSLAEATIFQRNTLSLRSWGLFKPVTKFHFDLSGTVEHADKSNYGIYNTSARYLLLPGLVTLKASHGYNYRMPTLNDIYWMPGGNPDLKPERGFSSDLSALYTPSWSSGRVELEALYYYMNIADWIAWLPTGEGNVWSPQNFSSVLSQGFEVSGKVKWQCGKSSHAWMGNYTYARSEDRSNRSSDVQGKQLPYIPRNKWNARYDYAFGKSLWANYSLSFTDVRFTTADESYYTPAYLMHNVEVGGRIPLRGEHALSLSLKVDNLFNSYYESTQYYPMPLRMFRLGVRYVWGD